MEGKITLLSHKVINEHLKICGDFNEVEIRLNMSISPDVFKEDLKNVRVLKLHFSENVEDNEWKTILAYNPDFGTGYVLPHDAFKDFDNLRVLHVYDCESAVLEDCHFDYLENIEELYISWNDSITAKIFKKLKNLKILKLENCKNLWDEKIDFPASLEEIHLIDDVYINFFKLKKLKNLKVVYFRGVDLRDGIANFLPENIKGLEIEYCTQIYYKDLLEFENLRYLKIMSHKRYPILEKIKHDFKAKNCGVEIITDV